MQGPAGGGLWKQCFEDAIGWMAYQRQTWDGQHWGDHGPRPTTQDPRPATTTAAMKADAAQPRWTGLHAASMRIYTKTPECMPVSAGGRVGEAAVEWMRGPDMGTQQDGTGADTPMACGATKILQLAVARIAFCRCWWW